MGKRGFRILYSWHCSAAPQWPRTPGTSWMAVARTIGAPNVKSIQYSGSGYIFGFGQSYQPGGPWVKFNLKSYTQLAD
jgi:hypothetical protein